MLNWLPPALPWLLLSPLSTTPNRCPPPSPLLSCFLVLSPHPILLLPPSITTNRRAIVAVLPAPHPILLSPLSTTTAGAHQLLSCLHPFDTAVASVHDPKQVCTTCCLSSPHPTLHWGGAYMTAAATCTTPNMCALAAFSLHPMQYCVVWSSMPAAVASFRRSSLHPILHCLELMAVAVTLSHKHKQVRHTCCLSLSPPILHLFGAYGCCCPPYFLGHK